MNAFYGETLNDWTSHAAVEKNGNVVAGVNHETKQHGEYEGKPSSEAQTDQINLSSTDTMIDYPMTTDATGYDGNSKGNEKKRPHDDDSSNIMEEKDKSSPPSMKKSNVGSIGGDRIDNLDAVFVGAHLNDDTDESNLTIIPCGNEIGKTDDTITLGTEEDDGTKISTNDDEDVVDTKAREEEEANFLIEWKNCCTDIVENDPDSSFADDINVFLRNQDAVTKAHDTLEKTYDQTHMVYEKTIKKIIGLAKPLYHHVSAVVNQLEHDIVKCFGDHHETRNKVLAILHEHNGTWQRQYEELVSKVLPPLPSFENDEEIPHNKDDEAKDGRCMDKNAKENDKSGADKENSDGVNGDDDGDKEQEDPDWDALVELDHEAQGMIETFLKHRDQWQSACQQFNEVVQGLEHALRRSTEDMLATVDQAGSTVFEKVSDLKLHIQHMFLDQHGRRHFLDEDLNRVLLQQQSLFAKLKARVVGNSDKQHKKQKREAKDSFLASFFGSCTKGKAVVDTEINPEIGKATSKDTANSTSSSTGNK